MLLYSSKAVNVLLYASGALLIERKLCSKSRHNVSATKRQDTSYNSYKKTGYFIQQLQRYRTLHTTATKRQEISYKSYKETGHFIQQLQRDRTLPTTATKRQDTSYDSYKETGHFIQQLLTQKLQEYIDYQKLT